MRRTPVRNLEPGNTIVLDHFTSTPDRAGVNNTPNHERNAEVRHDYSVALSFREENGIRCMGVS